MFELKILGDIIDIEKNIFNLTDNVTTYLTKLIDLFYNPIRTRSTLRKNISKLSDTELYPNNTIEKLVDLGFIYVVPYINKNKITVTPEGYIYYIYKINNEDYDKLFDELYTIYKKICYSRIDIEKDKSALQKKHISPLLFLLLNGNVGKDYPYLIKSIDDEIVLEKIVNSFIGNKNDSNQFYALPYYLVEAKKILGDVIYNKKPKYYIKKNYENYIISEINSQLTNKKYYDDWERMKITFKDNLTYLQLNNNSYYEINNEINLDKQLKL